MRSALVLLTATSLFSACGRDSLDTQPPAMCDAGVSVCGWNASTKTWDLDCHLACPASACASGALTPAACVFDSDRAQFRCSYYCRERDAGVGVGTACTAAAATTYYSNDPRCPGDAGVK